MKPEMITLKHGDTTIKMPAASLAKLAVASVFAQVLPPAANVQPIYPHSAPELGAVWPGQGGFNAGLVAARDDVPAHYLIVATKDAGDHEWGARGIEVKGLSKTDGYTNAQVLIGNEDETKYPASNACAEYQADGHHDFYLPAAAELYHCWLNVPELFAKDTWYWSSSQRSANLAFFMYFDVGNQGYNAKDGELRVRPVRRLFI
ncbi:DUF1566 domain-containing protein [Pseudomonas bubulae]|uniref:DUF1566 domain-containing protein n=1 Tax=Pseudomonas bubulae TaxID=2316085 RepID=UPI001F1573C0|nr:DUF1566 domain-containing protein [Pseudomonas bubulae]MCF3193483.1 DUF1566 domain-containing protein [Pseudomonas bubulae]